MELTARQSDRAAGVLLGQACGDALGVPYEYAATKVAEPVMKGGGLGPYSPGEWSDDTQMAICIAEVAATGADLASTENLDLVAHRFLAWFSGGASDVGSQTRAVLSATRDALEDGPIHGLMTAEAKGLLARGRPSAGNGALMRTSVVGLSALDDRDLTAGRARAVAELTHADPLAGDSCVIWSELVRQAVLKGELDTWGVLDLIPGDRRSRWAAWLRDAVLHADPALHLPNGYTVHALQAALAAVASAQRSATGARRLQVGLITAVRAGGDTDTVAAIAGGLLGALHGASAVPAEWRRQVHGWPGLRARDLIRLAVDTARGAADPDRWPSIPTMDYPTQWDASRALGVPHPHDEGVVIGTMADLDRLDELEIDAVISLCRRGVADVPAPGIAPADHFEFWLVDSEDPDDNADPDFVLDDAASTIEVLRAEGKRVLVHCVAAQQRAPSVAARYAVRQGVPAHITERALAAIIPTLRGRGPLWRSALHPETSTTTKGA